MVLKGKRVKKEVIATGETTVFVYSSGKLVAEYSNATPPATTQVSYTTTDHLHDDSFAKGELPRALARG